MSDFTTSIPEYGNTQPTCYDFKGPGVGKGECVKNNAASAYNRRSGTVRLYILPNCGSTGRWVLQPGPASRRSDPLHRQEPIAQRGVVGNLLSPAGWAGC